MSLVAETTAASDTAYALRVATAAGVCLALAEWWRLPHANLAVWTTHMVMVSVPFTVFQKGVERIVGRGLGVFAGILIQAAFPNQIVLPLIVEAGLIALAFYIYFAGRFAYTALNAGLYLAAILQFARSDPDQALPYGIEVLTAVTLGVVVADVVNWLAGKERKLTITAGTTPLLPVRLDWLNRATMLCVTAMLTQLAARWLDLPATQAVISVMVLTVAADIQGVLLKGKLRLLGAVLGSAWALFALLILTQIDHFPLLLVLVFFGMFLAAYLAKTGGRYAYAGVQMGLVLPLIVVVPSEEFGTLTGAYQRMQGVVSALAITIAVAALWPRFELKS